MQGIGKERGFGLPWIVKTRRGRKDGENRGRAQRLEGKRNPQNREGVTHLTYSYYRAWSQVNEYHSATSPTPARSSPFHPQADLLSYPYSSQKTGARSPQNQNSSRPHRGLFHSHGSAQNCHYRHILCENRHNSESEGPETRGGRKNMRRMMMMDDVARSYLKFEI
ncbi:hypothetical protein BJV74DRAFT_280828 [Russula compacta]|nr:hypothetical protein BJV74DRAFT_280828 [Russula compacta]